MSLFRSSCFGRFALCGLLACAGAAGGAAPGHGPHDIDLAQPLTPEQAFSLALEAETQRDRPAVLHWLRRAARAELLPAQEMLGVVLMQGVLPAGEPRPQERCEARDWFHRAALQGSAIGRMHRDFINRSPEGRRCA